MIWTYHLTNARARALLGNIPNTTLARWVASGRIAPVHKFRGTRGEFLFDPVEVERVRDELVAQAAQVSA